MFQNVTYLYHQNMLSNARPTNEIDVSFCSNFDNQPVLLQQNAAQEQVSRTLYVGNLIPEVCFVFDSKVQITEDELIKIFSSCGVINLAKIACEGMGLKADAGKN